MRIGVVERLKQRFAAIDDARQERFAVPDLRAPRREANVTIAVLVYTGVTTSEIDAPVRVLATGLDADVVHVAESDDPVVGIEPVRTVHVDRVFGDSTRSDVVVIPGGLGWQRVADDTVAMNWLVQACAQSSGILAISTGSLLLASAGRLAGERATGHWLARDALAALGADVSTDRTTTSADSRVVTASGAHAALSVCAELATRLRWGP